MKITLLPEYNNPLSTVPIHNALQPVRFGAWVTGKLQPVVNKGIFNQHCELVIICSKNHHGRIDPLTAYAEFTRRSTLS